MTEPVDILGRVRYLLTREGPLQGRKVVVTAGGTREALDPVRYLGNRSSGKQGYALAQAALDAGAEVTLVTAARLACPAGARCVEVESAQEMRDAVLAEVGDADALIMAAAVADFRPAQSFDAARSRRTTACRQSSWRATRTSCWRWRSNATETGRPAVVVGFAAETNDLLENAQAKLEKKGLS